MESTPTFSNILDLIKHFEACEEKRAKGYHLVAEEDPGGLLTIGYGHTGKDVYEGMTITEKQAEQYLISDLSGSAKAVARLVKVSLSQKQKDALMSFTFNLGEGALAKSTLLRRLNAGESPNTVAREELPKWCKCKEEVLNGLVRRRAAEVAFFCS